MAANLESRNDYSLVESSPATIAEVAKFLKISRGSIYNLIHAGELVKIQLPGIRTTRIPWAAVHDLQRRSLCGPVDELVSRIAEAGDDAPALDVIGTGNGERRNTNP